MKQIKVGLLASMIMLLTACGGGGSTYDTITGTFIDDAVEGLNYSCEPSKESGVTNENGEYTCSSVDTVTFKLGDILLGSAKANTSPITPYDLFPDNVEAAVNLAQLLQSLEEDGNLTNGKIKINDTLVDVLPNTVDFNSTTFSKDVDEILSSYNGYNGLVSKADAIDRMNDAIVSAGRAIPAGLDVRPSVAKGFNKLWLEGRILWNYWDNVLELSGVATIHFQDNNLTGQFGFVDIITDPPYFGPQPYELIDNGIIKEEYNYYDPFYTEYYKVIAINDDKSMITACYSRDYESITNCTYENPTGEIIYYFTSKADAIAFVLSDGYTGESSRGSGMDGFDWIPN